MQVVKVRTVENQAFAIKIIRNRHAFRRQAEVEVELLRRLKVFNLRGTHKYGANVSACAQRLGITRKMVSQVPLSSSESDAQSSGAFDARSLVVQLREHFVYRDHLCIVCEQVQPSPLALQITATKLSALIIRHL